MLLAFHSVGMQERLEGRTISDETIKKESMYINQSLSYLEQCVVALSRRNAGHVPYRQSKLTNVLKVCLGLVHHTSTADVCNGSNIVGQA